MKRTSGAVLLILMLFIPTLIFAEDTSGHWAAQAIAEVRADGIMTGTGDGFMPDRNITRAEFVTAIIRAIKAEPTTGSSRFSDVNKDSFYAPYINRAAELGLASGFDDGTFRPDSSITREEAMVVLSRAFGYLSGYKLGKSFDDYAQITEGARAAVGYALKEKIISGYPDNTLRPRGSLTRAEAAVLILRSRALERSTPGFTMGYPKLSELGKYEHISIELSTNMPCTVYYMLNNSDMPGIPAQISVTNPLAQVSTANVSVTAEISAEIGKVYNLSLMAVTPDGRRSNVVQIQNVTPCPYADGDGSVASPYVISDAEQLDAVRFFADKAFILKNDITLFGDWEPIAEFYGIFDGNGYGIDGLYVNTDKRYAGFFGKIVKGEVKNLSISGTIIARANAGIFAGELLDAKVTSCVASGRVEATTNNAGGFFGESAGRITNSLSSVYVVEASSFAGGIVGQNYGIIQNCISAAHTVTASLYAGGVSAVNLADARIEATVAANINVYDMMMDNCGRVTANKQGAICKNNYAYSAMRTSAENAINELDNNNGADIGWEELISKDSLCKILGWDKKLWTGGSRSENYLIPYPASAKQPKLIAGICEYAPVRVARAAELLGMISNPNMHYLLVNDITFGDNLTWTPAADTLSYDEGFTGTLDGNGHTIYGLKVKRSRNGVCGLFGLISSGEVRNLRLSNVTLTGGDIIGAIAAINYGNIKNCVVENITIRSEEADVYIGGLCGYNYANIQDSAIAGGNMISDVKNTVIGGIAAHNEGFVDNVRFYGNITSKRTTGIAESVAGGVCGYNSGGMIYNAYAKVQISQQATTVYSGGVCAIQNGGELYKCAAQGGINCNSYEGNAVSYAGGVCGLAVDGIVMHTYSMCDIVQYTPRCYAGGVCGYIEAAVVQNGYSTSDILQEKPYIALTEVAYAGGLCGYNEGGIIASMVAMNKRISTYGIAGRVCAAGTEDNIFSNYAVKMSVAESVGGNFSGETVEQTELDYDFFTKPIAEGGKLGWAVEVWKNDGKTPVFW